MTEYAQMHNFAMEMLNLDGLHVLVSNFLFVCSHSEEHAGFHGLYASGSQGVKRSNRWHFCLHPTWLQAADLFWRWRYSHPLRQVTEEKPVLCVEGARSAHWRHQVLVRMSWLLITMGVFVRKPSNRILVGGVSWFFALLFERHGWCKGANQIRHCLRTHTQQPTSGFPCIGGKRSASWPHGSIVLSWYL